ncbi:MAG: hypothetical protein ABIK28_06350, partial [Planctomycetota bacterium]
DLNPLDELNFYTEVSGISAGRYGYFFDAEAGFNFIPLENILITGGYRALQFDVKADDDRARLGLAGPFLSASIRF